MAKERFINTQFWRDDYISNLDPSEKLLFLYFLTNTDTSICGIYQIPIKIISVDTGFDKEMILKILARFEKDSKMIYRNGWIAIKNFIKHQKYEGNIKKGIDKGLSEAPQELKEWVLSSSKDLKAPLKSSNYSNSNSNLKENELKGNSAIAEPEHSDLVNQENPTAGKADLENAVAPADERKQRPKDADEMANLFALIWMEKNPPGTAEYEKMVPTGKLSEEAERCFDHYSANGWKQTGGLSIKDYYAMVRNWIRNMERFQSRASPDRKHVSFN